MSERLNNRESQPNREPDAPETLNHRLERSERNHHNEAHKELLKSARQEIKELAKDKIETADSDQLVTERRKITPEDKKRAYKQALSQIQSQLPRASKKLSRLIHQPTVEKTSQLLEKSVARPIPVLSAAISATIGLLIMLYFARRYGFSVSGAELIFFLVVGWILGFGFEFIKKLARSIH